MERSIEALTAAGDALQSAASRLAEHIDRLEQGTARESYTNGMKIPYEVSMAAREACSAVDAWTKARTR